MGLIRPPVGPLVLSADGLLLEITKLPDPSKFRMEILSRIGSTHTLKPTSHCPGREENGLPAPQAVPEIGGTVTVGIGVVRAGLQV